MKGVQMHVVDLICLVLTAFEEVYCKLFDQRKCRQNTCTLVNQTVHVFFFFSFFFFSFAYTTSIAAVMKLVVFVRSSKLPYTFWWSGVADGHCAIRSGWCLLHIWRTCSVVWSSSPQGHVGEGNIFSFLCMCALSLLWSERSRAKITWPGLSKRWYASFSCLDFSAVLMIVVFCW